MSLPDVVTAAPILAAALYLLYRSLRRAGGGCHGCSAGGCPAGRPAERRLVTLGRAGRVPEES